MSRFAVLSRTTIGAVAAVGLGGAATLSAQAPSAPHSFLESTCYKCHSEEAESASALFSGFYLDRLDVAQIAAAPEHQDNPTRMERYAKLNAYHMGVVSKFVAKLAATDDGDGKLLDHMLMLYGSPMANSNAHDHYPLPVVVFGHAAGRYQGDMHVMAKPHTPMTNLFMAIAAKEDIDVDRFGDSNGVLEI